MRKLLAYVLNGQIIGVEKTSWDNSELSGNDPFKWIFSGETIPNGYVDISSILNWGLFGENVLNYNTVRFEISKLLPESLTELNESELSVVQNYVLDHYYRIYDYINYENFSRQINAKIAPLNIDYDIIGLHKKRFFRKGELYRVEYYGEYNPINQTYSKLCVSEDRTYYRTNKMLSRREMTITWYYTDGTSGETKKTTKYYTVEEAIQAGEVRRRNVISTLKTNTVGLIMMTLGVTQIEAENLGLLFLEQYNSAIFKYIEGAESVLKNILLTDTNHSWLDNVIPNTGGLTIRMYLYDNINIDYNENNINT